MFEKSADDLAQEMEQLIDHEQACNRLITLIESDDELDMSPYLGKVALATLNRVSDVISHRVHVISDHLEEHRNEAFDNFMKGKF